MAGVPKERKEKIGQLIEEIKVIRKAEDQREVAKALRDATQKLLVDISSKK